MKKMNRRITLLAVFLCTMVAGVYAQSDDFGIWTSAEVKKKIFPGFDASVEGEFRTRDGVDNVERWSAGAGVAYRITSFLKADGGYTFIYSHRPGEMTKKGNYVSDYWSPRHRMYLSLTGKLNWQRFEFSLRERYSIRIVLRSLFPSTMGTMVPKKQMRKLPAKVRMYFVHACRLNGILRNLVLHLMLLVNYIIPCPIVGHWIKLAGHWVPDTKSTRRIHLISSIGIRIMQMMTRRTGT